MGDACPVSTWKTSFSTTWPRVSVSLTLKSKNLKVEGKLSETWA